MEKAKRKAKKKPPVKVNALELVDISKIGTQDDPCFGKLFKVNCEECQSCGAAELCAIVTQQSLTKVRKKIEKDTVFIDQEEVKEVDKVVIRRKIKARIIELAKGAGKEGISDDIVFDDIKGSYARFGFSMSRLRTIIKKVVLKVPSLTQKKNKILWKH